MENNENLTPEQETPVTTPAPEASPAPQRPSPKVSPFEDSPYILPDSEESPAAEPQKAQPSSAPTLNNLPPIEDLPKKQRSGKKAWKVVAVVAILLFAMIPYAVFFEYLQTSNGANSKLILNLQQQIKDLQEQIVDLEQKVEDNSFTGNGNSVSGTGTADGLTPGQVYAQNYRAVVAISNQGTTTNIYGQVTETASSGSGFIISEDGYVVTNYHVVDNATKLTVILNDGTEHAATLVGYDDSNDFALLKIDATDLPTVKLGDSEDLIIGDQVIAIGNPLGELTNSLTVGYISAKERDVTTDGSIINMLQTDAAINPGNSGGPLFNMKGEVIGITTAKYSGTTSSGASIEGIGFAIPVNDVTSMIDQLLEKGYISAPFMGVNVDNRMDGMGVYVVSVQVGSPAETAGLKAGDIIVGIGEYTVTTLADLSKTLRNFSALETTTLQVYRDRQVLELSITFAEKNQPINATPTGSSLPQDGTAEQWYEYWLPNFGG